MSGLGNFFIHSELALAAYAGLYKDIVGDDFIAALEDGGDGFSSVHAQRFGERWRVIEQFDHYVESTYVDEFGQEHLLNNPSGLSVTLFEEIGTGKQCIAIRGTNDPADVVTDVIDIAVLGTWERQAQYESLNEMAPANCRRCGF